MRPPLPGVPTDASCAAAPSADIAAFARGFTCHRQGDLDQAAVHYEQAIALNPGLADALHLLGTIRAQLGHPAAGAALIERALVADPTLLPARSNLANALSLLGRHDEALASLDLALAVAPDNAEFLINKADVLKAAKRYVEAVAAFGRAIEIAPSVAAARSGRAYCLGQIGRLEDSIADYEEAMRLDPRSDALGSYAQLVLDVCDWRKAAAIAPRLDACIEAGVPAVFPFAYLGYGRTALQQRRCAEVYVAANHEVRGAPATREPQRRERIRIAYLSADFHAHATSHLAVGLFEAHDRARFEVHGVSYGPDDGSAMRRRVVAAFDRFHDAAAMTDLEVAHLLARDEIDIAIEINGLTGKLRLGAMAARPAPVQVAYLGYPGTSGAAFIDYIIADRWVAPFEAQPAFSEQIVHMPHSYQVNDARREIAAAVPSRAACGLPATGFVFCCFNANYKITPPMFAIWMRLLTAVPGSVLWLLESNPVAPIALRAAARQNGVDPTRLVFAGKVGPDVHLARHAHADLALDTLPYTSHTTGSDALWAGVPMVTCVGDSFAGRVGASLLDAVGLAELVTQSPAAYGALALALAREPDRLRAIRRRLADQRKAAPLFDTQRFTRDIERAYTTMWEAKLRGEPARAFAVQPSV